MNNKKFVVSAITLAVLSAISSSSYANIVERPQYDKQYNDFVYYDGDGSKVVSLQDYSLGKALNYYFNKGALIDGSNSDIFVVILSYNGTESGYDNPLALKTEKNFYIGKNQSFTVKNYKGYSDLVAKNGASLSINGGNIYLETGVESSYNDYVENLNAAIVAEDLGKVVINSENLTIGNAQAYDHNNCGAGSVLDSDIDITLSGQLNATNVDFGFVGQTSNHNHIKLQADEGINIDAKVSTGKKAKLYNGSGLYALAYHNDNSKFDLSLTSNKKDINVKAQGFAYYGYGNVNADFNAKEGSVTLISTDDKAVYVDADNSNQKNTFDINAKNDITLLGKTYGLKGANSVITTNSNNLNLIAKEGQGINLGANAHFEANAKNDLRVEGKTFGVVGSNALINTTSENLYLLSPGAWAVFLNKSAVYNATVNSKATVLGGIYVSNGDYNLTAPDAKVDGMLSSNDGGNINIKSQEALSLQNGGDVNAYVALSTGKDSLINLQGGKVTINGDLAADNDAILELDAGVNSYMKGGTREVFGDSTSEGVVNLKFGNNSLWELTKNSTVSQLNMTASTLDFSSWQKVDSSGSSHKYHNLSAKTFIGEGNTLKMQIDLTNEGKGNKLLDQFDISGKAYGNQIADIVIDGRNLNANKLHSYNYLISQGLGSKMNITGKDGTNNFTGNGMTTHWSLVFVKDGYENKLDDKHFLEEIEDDFTGVGKGKWYLVRNHQNTQNGGNTQEMNELISLGVSTSQAMSFASEIDDLRVRLGEVRYGAQDGLWVKADNSKDRAEGYNGRGFKQTTYGVHAGYDHLIKSDEKSAWLLGGAIRYANSTQKGFSEAEGGNGDLDQYSLKMYATYMNKNGSYADFVLQGGLYQEDIEGISNDGVSLFNADFDTVGFGGSIEVGHMFSFNNDSDDRLFYNHTFIEPQLQLSYFNVQGKNYSTSKGMEVSQGDAQFLTGRLGLVLGKKFNYGTLNDLDKQYLEIAVTGGIKYEFLGEQDISFKGVEGVSVNRKADSIDGIRYYYGLNCDWQLSENTRAYAHLEREEEDNYTKEYDLALGIKYQF